MKLTDEEIKNILHDLKESYKHSTQGKWQKGLSTHHTVTETGYRIAEFHHADDAQFCDVAHGLMPQVIAALEAALSAKQGEQEAVAFMYPDDYERMITSETFCTVYSVECGSPTQGKTTVALYTHPAPKAEPLTAEQYTALAHRIASKYAHRSDPKYIAYTFLPHTLEQFVRVIEAAHGIKGGA